jgi:putative flippase GtrA
MNSRLHLEGRIAILPSKNSPSRKDGNSRCYSAGIAENLNMNLNINFLFFRYPLTRQLFYFGIVGTTAAIVQLSIVIFLVRNTSLHPLVANVVGFLFAFNVSYFGHRRLTFEETQTQHPIAIRRLFSVAACTFIANESLFYIFLRVFKIHYFVALLLVLLILPISTFILNKYWVFRVRNSR